MENVVPEISNEDAKQHDKLTSFLREIKSCEDGDRAAKDKKSVMTFKTYMSSLEESPGDLENMLQPNQLDSILVQFETSKTKSMDLETFQKAVFQVLHDGNDNYNAITQKASRLFKKIDWLVTGVITPTSLCEFFLSRLKNEKKLDKQSPLDQNEKIIDIPFIKESIMKIMIDVGNPLKYIIVTKDNQIFHISSSNFTLKSNIDSNTFSAGKSLKKRWLKTNVTDAICLQAVNKLVIATANRDLQFYDMATSMYMLQFHLIGLPSCVLCMFQHCQKSSSGNKLLLFFGTDYGTVHLLTFHMPEKSLFETPFQKAESTWKILFSDLQNHVRYVSHKTLDVGQQDWIQQISYVEDGEQLISACLASKHSLVFYPVNERKGKIYSFSLSKGIQCFDYNKGLGLLVTGSNDHMLRFWDPYVTSRPMAILKTHRSCIISVFIHTSLQMVFSYSKDKHVCVFDIKDQVCIQNICIKHPSGQTNIQEHGPSPLLYTGTSILVAANSYVAELKFMEPSLQQSGRAIDDYSHSTRVIDAIILQVKNQLLTACECGEIKLWNIKTGQLVDTLSDATNCFSELSCVGVDCTNEWLVCGYVDGTANLWSLTKGLKEKSLEKYSSKEITNVIVLPGMSAAFLFGWSRKILAYYDTKLSVSLKPDPDWLLLECHEDDILCAVYIRPLYIVTSSFDGDIYLWNIEYKRLARKIQIGRNRFKWRKKIFENFESPRNGLRSSRSRRSSNRAISSILFKEPVECLLYLTERSNGQYASLVSAEGSTIKFWSTIAVGLPTASFDICENEGVIVTSITSDKNNAVLVTGDSEGLVRVWSIEGYGGYNRFSEVILQVMRKQNSRQHSRSQATRTFPPPLLQSWLAHDSHVVTCLQIFENASSEKFLLSGGSDCRVFLWSLKGMKIGVFTRISRWNLDKKIRNGKKHVYEYENNKSNENNDILKSKVDFVEVNNREGGDNLEKLHERIRKSSDEVHLEESALPWKQTYDLDGIKLSDCHSAREEIHQRIDKMKESWSLLGENYNNEFRVRMTNRLNRRLAESLDNPVNGAGGLTMCTPFSKVMIKDLDDITLSTKDFSLVKSKDRDVTASKYAGKNI